MFEKYRGNNSAVDQILKFLMFINIILNAFLIFQNTFII